MFHTILYIILGYYLLTLLVQLGRLLYRRYQATHSSSVRFNLGVSADEAGGEQYWFLEISPWFYDEADKFFTFAFSLRGFSIYFVPVETVGGAVRSQFGDLVCWQLMYDSQLRGDEPELKPLRSVERLFSGGNDFLILHREQFADEARERFRRRIPANGQVVGKNLLRNIFADLRPDAVVMKGGNQWLLAFRDSDRRADFLTGLLGTISQKVVRKNRIEGEVSARDAARAVLSRGQAFWWMHARLDGDAVALEGEGRRPGEATSADWLLVSIPVQRSGTSP